MIHSRGTTRHRFTRCAAMLKPRTTWRSGAEYDQQAAKLAAMFVENFKAFEDGVSADVRAAGPRA